MKQPQIQQPIVGFAENKITELLKFKEEITGQTDNNGIKIGEILKCLALIVNLIFC